MSNNEQINVPTLLAIIAVSGLVLRYLFFSTPASSRAAQTAARESSTARNREASVAQLQQMFPQVDRRTLLWDLQRTGGNMAATTERVLAGRLETPPQTFQPPPPPSPPASQAAAPASQSTAASTTAESKSSAPDLITRYHLQDKLASATTEPQEGGAESGQTGGGGGGGKGAAGKAWSSNKEERQSLLQRRRDQMILEARRKMEARIRAEKEKAEGAGGGS
ncbi:hypothetical protein GE09DRAFT_339853 [Coniochaeta sp. 2T2.1]|nr:hypothetical protein GE09DRAFT_339853 [Coniochaeta sp. 2T2.1]